MTRFARNLRGMAPLALFGYAYGYTEIMNKKYQSLLDAIFHWQKPRNNARPPDTEELRWKAILSVLDAIVWLLPARLSLKQGLLVQALYVSQISWNSFSWVFLGKTCLHWAYFIWLAEGNADKNFQHLGKLYSYIHIWVSEVMSFLSSTKKPLLKLFCHSFSPLIAK